MILLEAQNICHSIKGKSILEQINFKVNKGDIFGIAGESGSGKTTLARIAADIIPPSEGKIILHTSSNGRIFPVQLLFQNNGEIINPYRRIFDMVFEVVKIKYSEKKIRKKKEELEAETRSIFESVDFGEHLYKRKGHQLSGGEQQRGAIARLLAASPEILILDEPFSAQDPDSQKRLLDLFLRINKELGITLICVSHNINLLKLMCSYLIIMYKGRIVEHGKSPDLLENPEHPYTKFLLKAEGYDLKYEDFLPWKG